MTSPMIIEDLVYGRIEIGTPLLQALVNSTAVQRLRGISQAGASRFVRRGRNGTRFEHSLGVMHVTKLLGGSEIEQAAGLLQDVSHTPFSHTIDYVMGTSDEDFHENVLQEILVASDLPGILETFGYTIDDITNRWALIRVDQPAPDLCADRIDYTLRDLGRLGRIETVDVLRFLSSLEFCDDKVVLNDVEVAVAFVEWYHDLVQNVFMNPLELYAHAHFAETLNRAISGGVLSVQTLVTGQDEEVLERIAESPELAIRFRDLQRTTDSSPHGHGTVVRSKARVVDPLVKVGSSLERVSALRPQTALIWGDVYRIASEGILVREVT